MPFADQQNKGDKIDFHPASLRIFGTNRMKVDFVLCPSFASYEFSYSTCVRWLKSSFIKFRVKLIREGLDMRDASRPVEFVLYESGLPRAPGLTFWLTCCQKYFTRISPYMFSMSLF